MSFLRAEWRKLIFLNYEVDPQLLSEYLPFGTELDFWQGKCYVSVVGFVFIKVKVLGLPIPYHINFEEVNLRFYVKRKEGNEWKRGVVFIKEIVPKPTIAFVANVLYGENYISCKMNHTWKQGKGEIEVNYSWNLQSSRNLMTVVANAEPIAIEDGTMTEFITEHYWGYAKRNELSTNEYEVTHPKWLHYIVKDYQIDINFRESYGLEFAFLNDLEPSSVMLAEGSLITVESKKTLK